LMIWRSCPVVVVGKHQNTIAEINSDYIERKGISVARRLSGGGAVYHDEGNLNFTFIVNSEGDRLIDFKRFIDPITKFINSKGAPAVIGKQNDILVEGKKISGNAEHIFKTRVLHHGTLLYNSDLDAVHKALSVIPGRFIDKAIQSNRSAITNLKEYIKDCLPTEDFVFELFRYLCEYFKVTSEYKLNEMERIEINKLRDEKYSTWEWIFGYSPEFDVNRVIQLNRSDCRIHLKIVKGFVKIAEIDCNSGHKTIELAIKGLVNCRYDHNEIKHLLENTNLEVGLVDSLIINLF
jgi:lipoate---protein ligase